MTTSTLSAKLFNAIQTPLSLWPVGGGTKVLQETPRKGDVQRLPPMRQLGMMDYDNDLVAYICVVDTQMVSWFYFVLDEPEWLDPKYCHQN